MLFVELRFLFCADFRIQAYRRQREVKEFNCLQVTVESSGDPMGMNITDEQETVSRSDIFLLTNAENANRNYKEMYLQSEKDS